MAGWLKKKQRRQKEGLLFWRGSEVGVVRELSPRAASLVRALDRTTGTEVNPLVAGAGTVVHPPGDGTEVDPPVAGVAIRLPRARSAADQQPLAAAGALCQPIFNTRSQLVALYLCLITSASSSNG